MTLLLKQQVYQFFLGIIKPLSLMNLLLSLSSKCFFMVKTLFLASVLTLHDTNMLYRGTSESSRITHVSSVQEVTNAHWTPWEQMKGWNLKHFHCLKQSFFVFHTIRKVFYNGRKKFIALLDFYHIHCFWSCKSFYNSITNMSKQRLDRHLNPYSSLRNLVALLL